MNAVPNYNGARQLAAAAELMVRTGVRQQELRLMEWAHVSFEHRRVDLPASVMKMKSDFTFFLSKQCVALLKEMHKQNDSGYVFPSPQRSSKPFGRTSIGRLLDAIGLGDGVVPHGCRSTMRSYLTAAGKWDKPVLELMLSHEGERNRVVQTYQQYEYVKERREAFQFWSDYLDSVRDDTVGEVIELSARA